MTAWQTAISDDFNRANAQLGSPWVDFTNTGLKQGLPYIVSNVITAQFGAVSHSFRVPDGYINSDQAIEIDVKFRSTSTQYSMYGVLRGGPAVLSGNPTGYECIFQPGTNGILIRKINGNGTSTQLGATISATIPGDNLTYTRIRAEIVGDTIGVYVGGNLLDTRQDSTYTTTGEMGWRMINSRTGVNIWCDNVAAYTVPSGGGLPTRRMGLCRPGLLPITRGVRRF